MAYRLKLQEPIAEGVRRVGLEQIEAAEAKLASNENVPAAIHDARRCLKRLRALLHLVRPGLDEDAYRREADHLAATGKLLSRSRDRHVMQQTLSKLQTRPGGLANATSARLRKLLATGNSRNAKHKQTGPDGRRPALVRLKRARRLFAGKAIDDLKLEHLVDGLETTYRKARKALRKAYAKPSDEAFHAWRKATQRHWRHMLLLSHGWPEALLARAGEAKELSRLLGEDHDYSVLVAFAEAEGQSTLGRDDLATLAALCRSRQEELRARAKPRGDRLFAEGDETFKERIARYWASATHLSGLKATEEDDKAPAPAVKTKRVPRSRRRSARRQGAQSQSAPAKDA